MKSLSIIYGTLMLSLASVSQAAVYNGAITTTLSSYKKDGDSFYYSKQVSAGPTAFNKTGAPSSALIEDAGGVSTSSTIKADISGISASSKTSLPGSFDYNTYYGSSSETWTYVDQTEHIDLSGKSIRFSINYSIDQEYYNTTAGLSFYVFNLGYYPIFGLTSNTFSNHLTGQWQSDWITGTDSLDYLLRVQTSASASNYDNSSHYATSWANISYEVAAVPEPETYAMFSLGLIVVTAGVAKRKKSV